MSAPLVNLPALIAGLPAKKKRVLLVDTSRPKRDLRSETMRKLGIEVDCAADISEARCWWRADLYDLVLINVQESTEPRDKFCDDMRKATPAQRIMFFVGKPEYLAVAPHGDGQPLQEDAEAVLPSQVKVSLAAAASDGMERWGILEACRRISAVRNVSDARARAIRNRPLPPRDFEISQLKRDRVHDIFDQIIPENAQ
jgi:CheY-like chemotaxis protein